MKETTTINRLNLASIWPSKDELVRAAFIQNSAQKWDNGIVVRLGDSLYGVAPMDIQIPSGLNYGLGSKDDLEGFWPQDQALAISEMYFKSSGWRLPSKEEWMALISVACVESARKFSLESAKELSLEFSGYGFPGGGRRYFQLDAGRYGEYWTSDTETVFRVSNIDIALCHRGAGEGAKVRLIKKFT